MRYCPMFADVSKSELTEAASLLTPIIVGAGTVLMRQGSVADEFLLVADGLVSVTRTHGDDTQILGMVRSGEALGEMSLLHRARRCATAVTIERTTVYAATPLEFFTLLEAVPSVKRAIVAASALRLRDNNLAA